jgi:hypothetical protein
MSSAKYDGGHRRSSQLRDITCYASEILSLSQTCTSVGLTCSVVRSNFNRAAYFRRVPLYRARAPNSRGGATWFTSAAHKHFAAVPHLVHCSFDAGRFCPTPSKDLSALSTGLAPRPRQMHLGIPRREHYGGFPVNTTSVFGAFSITALCRRSPPSARSHV